MPSTGCQPRGRAYVGLIAAQTGPWPTASAVVRATERRRTRVRHAAAPVPARRSPGARQAERVACERRSDPIASASRSWFAITTPACNEKPAHHARWRSTPRMVGLPPCGRSRPPSALATRSPTETAPAPGCAPRVARNRVSARSVGRLETGRTLRGDPDQRTRDALSASSSPTFALSDNFSDGDRAIWPT